MKKRRRVRLGIIGAGFGQYVHLPAFRSVPECRVIAIAAGSLKSAERAARQGHVPKAYGDWRKLVRDPEVDAISIAVPPVLQPGIARLALKYGKPVFYEKPLAVTLKAAPGTSRWP